jgi:hypothetical protein
VAYQRYLTALEEQQEVLAAITDIIMYAYAMESAYLRGTKLGTKSVTTAQMIAVFLRDSMDRAEASARSVLAAASEGDMLRTNLAVLRRLAKYEPVNAIEARRAIARRLLEAERYTV